MRFSIGPWVYALSIVDDLRQPDGEPAAGLCDNSRFQIYLNSILDGQGRISTLLHEIQHAWCGHFPQPRTEEELADFQATITTSFLRDLKANGGYEALYAMTATKSEPIRETYVVPCDDELPDDSPRPVRQRESVESQARAAGGRAQCGVCSLIVADGQIINEPSQFGAGGRTMRRSLYCCHCEHIQSWIEGVDLRGQPNGSVVDGPFYDRSGVDRFLQENGNAVGLIVA